MKPVMFALALLAAIFGLPTAAANEQAKDAADKKDRESKAKTAGNGQAARPAEIEASAKHAREIQEAVDRGDRPEAERLIRASNTDSWVLVETLAWLRAWEAMDFTIDVSAREAQKDQSEAPGLAPLRSYVEWRRKHPVGSTVDGVTRVMQLQGEPHDASSSLTDKARCDRLLLAGDAANKIGWRHRADQLYFKAQAIAQNSNPKLPFVPILKKRLANAEEAGLSQMVRALAEFLAGDLLKRHRYTAAATYAHKALELATKDEHKIKPLKQLSTAYAMRGEPNKTIRMMRQLRAIETVRNNVLGVAGADVKWAAAAASLGRPTEALARLEPALRVLEEKGGKPWVRGGHLQAAMIALSQSDYARALHHVSRADEASVGLNYKDYRLRHFEARALRGLGRYKEAAQILEELYARLPSEAYGERMTTLALQIMGWGEASRRVDVNKKLAQLKALTDQHGGDARKLQFAFCDMGVASRAERFRDAIAAGKTAETYANRIHNPEELIHIGILLSRAYWGAGDARNASAKAQETLRRLTEHSASLPEQAGTTYRLSHRSVQRLAADAAVVLKDYDGLFASAERAFAVALRGRVGEESTFTQVLTDAEQETQDELRVAERRAALNLRSGSKKRAGEDNETRRASLKAAQKALSAAQSALERHRAAVRARHVIAGQILFPVIDTLRDAQNRLAGDSAQLVMIRGQSKVYALVVTKDEARLVDLGAATTLEATMGELALSDPLSDPAVAVQLLAKRIGEPIRLPPAIAEVAVMAQGDYARLPYAAIWPSRRVRMIPSVTVDRLLSERAADGEGVLAVADPKTKDVPRLPGANREAKKIGTTVLVEDKATEPSFFEALKERERWRSVHLACHAAMNEKYPLRSALILAPTKESDGLFTVSELLSTRIETELAVLAACSAGQRSWRDYEGAMTFTHAMFVAGARRVIVSLWDVNDEASSALLTKFYELWTPKTTPVAALSQAQQWMRTQKKWKHPAHWAGWQIWGPR